MANSDSMQCSTDKSKGIDVYKRQDIPLARWADVLLMYAEAEVRKNNAAPSADAVAAVNEVRKRAGLDDLPSSATASAEAFLDALLTERGHEMLYEGMRKIDLIRFNQYAQRTAKIKGVAPTHQYVPCLLYTSDDCGQMSAWYMLSAMGFYPVDPVSAEYVFGAPQLPKMTLHLADGKTFTIIAENLSKEHKYVDSITSVSYTHLDVYKRQMIPVTVASVNFKKSFIILIVFCASLLLS